jgi:type I restriction enzyme M protein
MMRRVYNNIFMIVECKKPNITEGRNQLEIYMGLSNAQIGVWFNGKEHLYLQKIYHKDGRIEYRKIPIIPKKGQRVEDIGKYQRKTLQPPTDLKFKFRDIRNHLAGMATGITRDVAFAQEMINILFCKV